MKNVYGHDMSKTVFGRLNFKLSAHKSDDYIDYYIIIERKTAKMVGTINSVPTFQDGTNFLLYLNIKKTPTSPKGQASFRMQSMEQLDNFLLEHGKFADFDDRGVNYRVLKEIPNCVSMQA